MKVVLLSPLLACMSLSVAWGKGGGHGGGSGGGGHGGGGRRRSTPPYRRDRDSVKGGSLPASILKFANPFGCINLPRVDERLQVLTRIVDRKGVYKNATVVATDPACRFTVQPDEADADDLWNTKSVLHLSADPNWIVHVMICLIGALIRFKSRHRRHHDRQARAFDEAYQRLFLKEKKDEVTEPSVPQSTFYGGITDESDGRCQRVRVHLYFCPKHRVVTGRGADEDDGDFTVKGTYIGTGVKWTEKYHRGFTVEVRGTWHGERLHCIFLSSRGITGTFTLKKRKSFEDDAAAAAIH